MINQVTGVAMIKAKRTHFTNSQFSNVIISVIVAPFTFLKPISFVRLSEKKAARTNKPIQAIRIAIDENKITVSIPASEDAFHVWAR
jgi:hypothetical protein